MTTARKYYGQQAEAIGQLKILPEELRQGQELLVLLADDEVDGLHVDSEVTEEAELRFLEHGGEDPWIIAKRH